MHRKYRHAVPVREFLTGVTFCRIGKYSCGTQQQTNEIKQKNNIENTLTWDLFEKSVDHRLFIAGDSEIQEPLRFKIKLANTTSYPPWYWMNYRLTHNTDPCFTRFHFWALRPSLNNQGEHRLSTRARGAHH
ncbi:MAG: hypothetical protein ABJN36_17345, partial [Cyclobacteriaceae bacterium]